MLSKRNLLFVSLFLLLIIFLAFTYLFYTGPRYSIIRIGQTIEKRDYEEFSKYVDVDSIIDNMMNDMPEDELGLSALFSGTIKDTLESSLKTSVENGDFADGWINEMTIITLFTDTKIERNGKVADITIQKGDSSWGFSMRDAGSYWQIIKFEDFGELDTEENEEQTIINKSIGEEVVLATLTFTVNSFEEINSIPVTYGDPITPQEGKKLYKLNITLKNIDTDILYLSNDIFYISDEGDFQYEFIEDYIWVDDTDLLQYEEINPNLAKKGNLYYEIPEDSKDLHIPIGKSGTNELYIIDLQ